MLNATEFSLKDKNRLLLVAPYPEISQLAAEINEKYNLKVIIRESSNYSVEALIEEAKKFKIDALICRGGFALKLKEYQMEIPVVDIPVTGFDIIEAIYEARKVSKKIAIIGFSNVIQGVPRIEKILGIDRSRVYIRENLDDCEQLILNAMENGVKVIVGDGRVVKIVEKHKLPSVLIKSKIEAILAAYEEAERLIDALKQERVRTKKMEVILNNVYSGIIALDEKGFISSINPQAENCLGVQAKQIIGKSIFDIIPKSHLPELLEKKEPELGVIVSLGVMRLVFNRVPIISGEKINGIVITFQEVGQVQEVEKKIRNELRLKGHVAKMNFNDIIGHSKNVLQTIKHANSYSKVESVILINGETGVGKEVFAQSIHNASARASGPFVAVNCAALPSTLLESELFGYVKGAFTDARKEGKIGLFEQAHQGTLLLDEITEMPIELQARLLRVLQEKEIIRLGDDKVVSIDCRIMATTNRDLERFVEDGNFRADLFYRLNILNLYVPSLRERVCDIEILTKHFMIKFSKLYHKPVWDIDKDALEVLQEYNWPGNVRELSSVIERIIVLSNHNSITKSDLEFINKNNSKLIDNYKSLDSNKLLESLTYEAIQQALNESGGNQSLAANILGINRSTLWRKLKYYTSHK